MLFRINEPVDNSFCCGIDICCHDRNLSVYGNITDKEMNFSEQSTTAIASVYLILVFGLIITDLLYLLFSKQKNKPTVT